MNLSKHPSGAAVPDPADEPPIDTSLEHYLEERALAVAQEKARTAPEQAAVARLLAHRSRLMAERAAFAAEAIRRRHERGEIYSKARVAAINAFAASREALEDDVRNLYQRQADALGVLKMHARTHFGAPLVSRRLTLAVMPANIHAQAVQMQKQEESFARDWMAAIGDETFAGEIRTLQREAVALFRTSSRAMFLVTDPPSAQLDDDDAATLGKAWNKLDDLATALGVQPLSAFIAFDAEGDAAGLPAAEIAATVRALADAVASGAHTLPSKKKVLAVLQGLQASLEASAARGGSAHFEVDL